MRNLISIITITGMLFLTYHLDAQSGEVVSSNDYVCAEDLDGFGQWFFDVTGNDTINSDPDQVSIIPLSFIQTTYGSIGSSTPTSIQYQRDPYNRPAIVPGDIDSFSIVVRANYSADAPRDTSTVYISFDPGCVIGWGEEEDCTPTQFVDTQIFCSADLPYIWNNTPYTNTTIDTLVLTNAEGCDSLDILDLTVLEQSSSFIEENVCSSYTSPSGKTYTETGVFNDTIPNVIGCDSIITIDLTFLVDAYDLTTDNHTAATTSCRQGEWTHYYNTHLATPQVLLSIREGSNDVTFEPTITINPDPYYLSYVEFDAHTFVMRRMWNIETSGVLTEPVDVRFYFSQEEMDFMTSAADSVLAVNPDMVVSDMDVFKTFNGATFSPAANMSFTGLVDVLDLNPQSAYGTADGRRFVQINDLATFSGGGFSIKVEPSATPLSVISDVVEVSPSFALQTIDRECIIRSDLYEDLSVSVVDITGVPVLSSVFTTNQQFTIPEAPQGIYVISVKDDKGNTVIREKKFIP